MTQTLEIENELQSYELVDSLVKQREREMEMNQTSSVEAIDSMLDQLKGTNAHRVLVDN